ncbi:hypothetical protein [Aeromicrobium phragmitis]|uniref:hypothetical protein n=1 Tax=Aeromicrobium phragmitis TaxID=2478914 RepID=UPI00105B85AD|nr:hypothetical protein [Aeromicrobium phragmitis]
MTLRAAGDAGGTSRTDVSVLERTARLQGLEFQLDLTAGAALMGAEAMSGVGRYRAPIAADRTDPDAVQSSSSG